MGVVDVTGVLLCELVSNDNGDASFAGVSFLSLSLIDCDRANVLSSLATVLCSSSISVEMLSGSETVVAKERERKENEYKDSSFDIIYCFLHHLRYATLEILLFFETFMEAVKRRIVIKNVYECKFNHLKKCNTSTRSDLSVIRRSVDKKRKIGNHLSV